MIALVQNAWGRIRNLPLCLFLTVLFTGPVLLHAQEKHAAMVREGSWPDRPAFSYAPLLMADLSVRPDRSAKLQAYPAQLPTVWSYRGLSPFCKLDVLLDRRAPLNIRFRLGEVEYVDRLERKGPTRADY